MKSDVFMIYSYTMKDLKNIIVPIIKKYKAGNAQYSFTLSQEIHLIEILRNKNVNVSYKITIILSLFLPSVMGYL